MVKPRLCSCEQARPDSGNLSPCLSAAVYNVAYGN